MFGLRRLVVQTTPFTPYFGDEEYKLLQAVASLTGLAFDRARLFSHEREARQALEHADELKTQFVALAAHELRSPVTAIVGFTETLRHRRAQLSAGQREQMEQLLYEQVRRLAALVDQLLDLSRLEAEAVEIRPQRVAIADRLQEIVAAAAPGADIRVQVEGEPGAEAVVDVDALDRIVSNLVVNAFRHGRPPISVLAGNTGNGLRVTVEDRGAGVPSDLVPQLFERFSRGRDAADRSEGSGLGLAIARSYARAHRGELEYRPALPHGAAFEVMLPAGV
jgi:two-component system sensor histidine kinase MtrB